LLAGAERVAGGGRERGLFEHRRGGARRAARRVGIPAEAVAWAGPGEWRDGENGGKSARLGFLQPGQSSLCRYVHPVRDRGWPCRSRPRKGLDALKVLMSCHSLCILQVQRRELGGAGPKDAGNGQLRVTAFEPGWPPRIAALPACVRPGGAAGMARHSRSHSGPCAALPEVEARALGGSGGEHVAAAKISVAALRRRSPRTARRARSCHVAVAEVARLAQPRLAPGPATRARARVACPGRAAAANRASRSG